MALIVTVLITILSLAYLAAIPFGLIGGNKFGTTDAIILAALLFFNSVLIGTLDTLSISGKGIDFKVREVQKEQSKQKDEIKSLQFLLSYFVTQSELKRLEKLAERSSPYQINSDYDEKLLHTELRRLRSLDLIEMVEGQTIGGIREKKGDLYQHVRITKRGREYLGLRESIETQS
ncbi:MAG: hypothetical protein JWM21_3582 [Acidobacteria bacterium]|nr:hypothetical protein [Acidobacteriota bacterium]